MKALDRIAKEHFKDVLTTALVFLLIAGGSGLSAQAQAEVSRSTLIYKDTLKLDFYSLPEAAADSRPLLVLMHGGGFSGGRRDGAGETEFCNAMALKGYAVASISYRLTRKGESFGCDCPAETKISTFVKAAEDLSDAVGYLISRQELPAFDRGRILLAGSSAGAEAILNAAFMSGHHDFKNIKRHKYAAVISFAGAMVNSTYINQDNALPVLFFHGKKDRLVPYGTEPHHYCPVGAEGYLMLDGPETMASRLAALGKSYLLAFDPEGGHEWANKAYGETDLIDDFIEKVVLQEGFQQTLMRLDSN
jgi:acetyl esterase/lipase